MRVCVRVGVRVPHTGDDGDYSEPFCLNKEGRGSLVQIIEIVSAQLDFKDKTGTVVVDC